LNKNRPINLNLTSIKFPLAAITSISHRITGVILSLGVAFLLYLLQTSLASEAGFNSIVELRQIFIVKIMIWLILVSISYHLLAGVKHLMLDLGWGETKASAELGAKALSLSLLVIAVLSGIWLL
jgi:succinate dehydrogenase / fumarate reductase cytochrome b subunit